MYVKNIMRKDPVTISPEASFYEARSLIREKGVRHLPVIDKNNRIVGLLTDRDIRQVGPSNATTLSVQELHYLLGKLKVSGFMTPGDKLITVTPSTMVEKAAQLMRDHKIGCLPVLEGKELVGIITETDILESFMDLMGLKEKGTRITMALKDEPGQIHGVLTVFKKHDVNLISIVSPSPSHLVEGKRMVVFRINTQDYEEIVKELEGQGYEVLSVVKWPSM
jgi:acetoin utilization protein AcuB